MSERRPVYVLAPGGTAPPAPVVPGHDPVPLRHPDEMAERRPGVLLLPLAALDADQLVAALTRASAAPPEAPWLPILVQTDAQGAVRALPLSIGWPAAGEELARWAAGDNNANVFELRHVLTRVARSRHDLNNPLTSAMAETQLALMEVKEPEVRASLETIDQQLRRMRDLIASLKAIRAPF